MILSCVIPTIVCVTVILGLMITKVSMFVCQIATPSPGASSSTSRNSGSNRTPPRMTSDGASGKSGHGVEGTTAPSASKPALEDPWAFLEDELAEFQRVVAELEALRLKGELSRKVSNWGGIYQVLPSMHGLYIVYFCILYM